MHVHCSSMALRPRYGPAVGAFPLALLLAWTQWTGVGGISEWAHHPMHQMGWWSFGISSYYLLDWRFALIVDKIVLYYLCSHGMFQIVCSYFTYTPSDPQ